VVLVTVWQGFDPATQICPNVVLPPAIPFTLQITPVFVVPLTCTLRVTRWFAASVAVEGDTLTVTPAPIASVACAFFDASACEVTVTVTVFGLGAVAGAAYVTEFATELVLADWVVTTVNIPQELPLQPVPLSAHDSAGFGFEPGTGVNVATIVAVPPAGTLDGAEICSEKLLVMDTTAEICLEGSATLCAVSVTLTGKGRVRGAVYVPRASTVPHPVAHAGPERLQRIEVSGCPLLVTVA
jgi:hypothetical protein